MPIYEYQCDKCQGTFEELVRNEADEPTKCPSCGSKRIHRKLSVSSAPHSSSSAGDSCPARDAGCEHQHGPGCGCCCHGHGH